jgi:hypothetical protein
MSGNVLSALGDEILRLATSIKHGSVTASLMLRKLGAYPVSMDWPWRCENAERSNGRSSCFSTSAARIAVAH